MVSSDAASVVISHLRMDRWGELIARRRSLQMMHVSGANPGPIQDAHNHGLLEFHFLQLPACVDYFNCWVPLHGCLRTLKVGGQGHRAMLSRPELFWFPVQSPEPTAESLLIQLCSSWGLSVHGVDADSTGRSWIPCTISLISPRAATCVTRVV